MNILIVEDEALYADQLQLLIRRIGHIPCAVAENAEEALMLFEKFPIDLALIDINLRGEMDGLELGKWLRRFSQIPVIYITSYYDNQSYFDKASQLSAFAFIKKPIDETQLQRTITLALGYATGGGESIDRSFVSDRDPAAGLAGFETLILHMKSKLIRIHQQDILYIEADDKYCIIHLEDARTFQERITLKELSNKLHPGRFARTHRSFIVNLDRVQEINTSEFTIRVKDYWIPLGNSYKDYFLKKFDA